MKRLAPKPVNVCVYAPPRGGRWQSLKWTELIAQSRYDAVRDQANDVYHACGTSMCHVPLVTDYEGGLLMTFEDANRVLAVKVRPGLPVSHQLRVSRTGEQNSDWADVPPEQLDITFLRLGRYVSGAKESTCYHLGVRCSDAPT